MSVLASYAAVSMLVLSAGAASLIVRQQQGTLVKIPSGDVLSYFPFGVPGCYATGSAMGTKGQALTVARTSTRTCRSGAATMITCQANEACVATDGTTVLGLAVEPARTNYVLRSGSTCKAGNTVETSWTLTNATCVNDAGVDPTGASSMDTVTTTTNSGTVSQSVTTASSTTFVFSAFAAKASGTGTVTMIGRCGGNTATACTCWRSDGGVCTPTMATSDCTVKASIGTATVRLVANVTCNVAMTAPTLFLSPGDHTVATGTAWFWGMQVEVGAYATSYIPTEGTSAQRTAETISTPNPLAGTNPALWSVEATVTPENGRSWLSFYARIWSIGTSLAANSASAFEDPSVAGKLYLDTYDSAGTNRQSSSTTSLAAGSAHAVCMRNNGSSHAHMIDHALATVGQSGSGTGVFSPAPATFYFGANNSGTEAIGGYERDIKIRKGVCR